MQCKPGSSWIEYQLECTRTAIKYQTTTSSRTKNRCTCSPASGTPMTGRHVAVWRRPTGKRLRSSLPTRTLPLKAAVGRIHSLHASPPQQRIGGINSTRGICPRHRRWIMRGCSVISSYTIIAKTLRGFLLFLGSVPLALGLKIKFCLKFVVVMVAVIILLFLLHFLFSYGLYPLFIYLINYLYSRLFFITLLFRMFINWNGNRHL